MTPSDLRKRREELGISRRKLAARMGLTERALCDWESWETFDHPYKRDGWITALTELEREKALEGEEA